MTTIESNELTFEDILDAARRMRPLLRERSAEIDEARRLPLDLVDALKAAGAFRMNMPARWGGPELTSLQQIAVIEEYARGNASVAWCVMIGCDSGLYTSWLDDAVGRAMYPSLDMVQAGWVYPIGKAVVVDGGYELSGRWMFGSGCQHADWLGAGCWVYETQEDADAGVGAIDWKVLLSPAGAYEIHDTWYTTGLRGTGSTDYSCDRLFVPEERSFSYLSQPKREGTLYAGPDTFLRKMSGIPLGLARAAIDEAMAILATKEDRVLKVPYRDMPRVQTAVAECELLLGAARAYVHQAVGAIWDRYDAGEVPTAEERSAGWLSRLNAFQSARTITRTLYDVIGGSAVYTEQTPFDRYLRDAETMCQHIVGQEKGLELVGEMLLRGDGVSSNPFLTEPATT